MEIDAYATGIELSSQTQFALAQIGELWLQWTTAYAQNDREQGERVLDDLAAAIRLLGFERIPDLAAGALVEALEAAREGESDRAAWALAAARRLDPGSPEVSFGAGRVAWMEGSYFGGTREFLVGYGRSLMRPAARRLTIVNGGLWLLIVLLLAGGFFLVLQMASKGGALLRDLVGAADRFVPRPLSYLVALFLLLWPLLLPAGLLWLMLYWSVLLWGYGSPSERSVFVVLWVLLGLAPQVAAQARQRVEAELSPPVKALESLRHRSLYGGLFTDLGALAATLPESRAVAHLVGDLHWHLGQWLPARGLYSAILEAEPEQAPVLNNLGAYYLHKGDLGTATGYFQRATQADPESVPAFYNLSQVFSERYLFTESQASLRRARQLDDAQVNRWIDLGEEQRAVIVSGGVERLGEIRRELVEQRRAAAGSAPRLEPVRRHLSLLVGLGLVLAAVALYLARRQGGYSEPPIDLRVQRGWIERLVRVLTPGLASARLGEGWLAFLAVLIPVALLMIPLGGSFAYRVPWGFDPGNGAQWTIAALGLGLFFGLRLLRQVRAG